MAKRPKRRAPKPQPRFNTTPLSPGQLNTQAQRIAMGQLQPQLDEVGRRISQGQRASDTRSQQIQGWANWQQGNLDKAFSDTREALNNLISLQGNIGSQSQQSMASALRAGTQSTAEDAARLGAIAPDAVNPALASGEEANRNAQMSLGSGAGALLGFMGAERTLPSVGLGQYQEQERQRWRAQQQDLLGQKSDLLGQVPGLQASALKDLRDFELAKAQFGETRANNMFQQYLAEQELGLKRSDQTFQQWLARQQLSETKRSNRAQEGLSMQQFLHQKDIDWANVGINQRQVEAQIAAAERDYRNAKNKDAKERAKVRGEGIAKATEWLSGFMKPSEGQAGPSNSKYPFGAGKPEVAEDPNTGRKYQPATSTYQRLFDDALRGMTRYTSRSDALRILATSEYSDWRAKAKYLLQRMKRRGRSGPPVGSRKGTMAPGARGQTRPT